MSDQTYCRVLHIGFGKTANTTLQGYIFPKLARHFAIEYVDVGDKRIRRHACRMNLGKPISVRFDVFGPAVVSAEDLHGWDPYFWEERARKNREFFGKDWHVLITIREPQEYLSSVYVQAGIVGT